MLQPDWEQIKSSVAALISQEGLPADFADTVSSFFLPLACRIQALQQQLNRSVIIGINGAQGTGKSTLALFLEHLLSHHLHCPCARFSLDDIYLTKSERQTLSQQVHPLLLTRGVPGTHDVGLGNSTLDQFMSATADSVVPIPAFNKAVDDRVSEADWPRHVGPVKVILLEGWCVAARPEADLSVLDTPINALERNEDADGAWRHFVNQQLEEGYRDFFERIDYLVMLKAPSMECILEWRTLQEQKLAERVFAHQNDADASGVMNSEQIKRFIMHYERLTRAMLKSMPAQAQALFEIDQQHRIRRVHYQEAPLDGGQSPGKQDG